MAIICRGHRSDLHQRMPGEQRARVPILAAVPPVSGQWEQQHLRERSAAPWGGTGRQRRPWQAAAAVPLTHPKQHKVDRGRVGCIPPHH